MNTYTFLVENAESIKQIPSFVERLEAIEVRLGALECLFSAVETLQEEAPLQIPAEAESLVVTEGFDQGDWDELFADGGSTERSFNAKDHAELHDDGTR